MTWSSLFFCSSCCRRACSASSLACASLRAFSRSACPAEQCSRQSPSTRCASSSDTARTSSVCVRFISFRCVSLNDMCFSSRSSAYSCNASWVASTSSRSARSKSSSSWICVVTSTPSRISADRHVAALTTTTYSLHRVLLLSVDVGRHYTLRHGVRQPTRGVVQPWARVDTHQWLLSSVRRRLRAEKLRPQHTISPKPRPSDAVAHHPP